VTQRAVGPAQSSVQIILWEDIFVIIDDGSGLASDYEAIQRMVAEQSLRHTAGLGCLTIVPCNAKPPSQEVRKWLNVALETAPLRCICWVVEGAGFQAAMVRAVITGLRFVRHPPYPTHIAGDVDQALRWILPCLEGGAKRIDGALEAGEAIRAKRAVASVQSL
jgi:hypothetical protein